MRQLNFLSAAIFVFLCASFAAAHPLGNFSVNQYSRLEIENSEIRVRQILDLAEIPTFQESQTIDADKNGSLSQDELNAFAEQISPEYIANLQLSVNNQPVSLRSASKTIELKKGEGGLPILTVAWNLIGDLPVSNQTNRIRFENKNNANRIGWNEIVVQPFGALKIFDSNAFGSNRSDELKTYPEDMLSAPLSERAADFSITNGAIPENAKPLQNRDGKATATVQKDKFAELINVPEITFPIALIGLLVAFGLGAVHAMSPGHGKTVVGAYLVGSRGTIKHAAFLGLTVTITHTLGVFALGFAMLFASSYFLPEKVMPFLNFVSGLLVFFIGVTLFKNRLFSAFGWQTSGHHHDHSHEPHSHDGHAHDHSHGEHSHSHDDFTHTHDGHTHSHLPPEQVTWKSLLALGISGGLLPCPSALVLMLSAISLGRVGYGMILTLAFSLGLAATLMAVGIIFLYVGKIFDSPSLSGNRIVKALPVFSAFVIACVGAIICYTSLA